MLTLIMGRFDSGKSTKIKEKIDELTRKSIRSFLVVPEQATVITEQAYAEFLSPSAPLYFEVTNFSRLANTVFRSAGGISCRQISREGQSLLMWRALRECRHLFASPIDENKPENVLRFLAASDEFRMSGIDTDKLTEVVPTLTAHRNLQAKVNDYLLVNAAFRTLCEEKKAQISGSELSRLAHLLEEAPHLGNAHVFFDGFVSFTAEEMRIIKALMKTNDLTFVFDCPLTATPPLAYAEVYDTAKLLCQAAGNVPVKKEKTDGIKLPQKKIFHDVADSLFSVQTPIPYHDEDGIYTKEEPPIRIRECESVFDEANEIAAEICRLVQEEGLRYRDILLIGRNPESYRGILDEALARNGIPFYFAEKSDIEAYEPIKLILAAYSMRAANFRMTDVIAYLKCGFSGIPRDDCDALEIYMTAWNLQATRFTDSRPWTFHPRGYTADALTDSEKKLLDRLNLAKEKILASFDAFGGAPCERTVKEHATALVLFLEGLGVAQSLEERAKKASALGRRTAASDYRALYPSICQTLDRTVELLGDTVVSEKDFTALLSLAFSCVTIGSIPSAYDQVVIGDARMLRPTSPKHTILFGVNEGIFPGVAEENGFFNRAERRLLTEAGVPLPEEKHFASARERYDFLRAFLSPTHSLSITFARTSSALGPLQPSSVIERICKLGGSFVSYRSAKEAVAADLLYRRASALDLLAKLDCADDRSLLLTVAREDKAVAEKAAILDLRFVMPECRIEPRKSDGKPLMLSQSRLDSFASCPFAYTCKYVLRLREDNEADFRYAESGTFVHALLEVFFRYLREHHLSIDDLSEEKRLALLAEIASSYERSLFADDRISSHRLSHVCRRLTASAVPVLDALQAEFADSDFSPTFFELPIGDRTGIAPPPLLLDDGTPISIQGIVDRVDTCRINGVPYLRVIDYKTGSKTFDPRNIDRGIDLQMLLYLHTLVETEDETFRRSLGLAKNEKILPAGMFYLMTGKKAVPLDTPCTVDELRRVSSEAIVRSGLLLNDTAVIHAMARENAEKIFGLTMRKNGNMKASKEITLADADELDSYFSVMKNRIVSLGNLMCQGEAHALPLLKGANGSSSCEYCAYKSVCRNAKHQERPEESASDA